MRESGRGLRECERLYMRFLSSSDDDCDVVLSGSHHIIAWITRRHGRTRYGTALLAAEGYTIYDAIVPIAERNGRADSEKIAISTIITERASSFEFIKAFG